jgi:uncharacterized integral membrane protein
MLRWVLFAPLLVLLVLFALSNMDEVQLRLWPFDLAWATPLSVAVLLIAGFGFLLGAGIAWAAGLPHRRRARRLEEAARVLEAELNRYRQQEVEAARGAANAPRLPSAPAA